MNTQLKIFLRFLLKTMRIKKTIPSHHIGCGGEITHVKQQQQQ